MKNILPLLFIFLFSCKNPSQDDSLQVQPLKYLPSPTCLELEKFNLHNAVIFFDDKGLVEIKDYDKFPSQRLLAEILSDSLIVQTLKESHNFAVIDFTCGFGKTIRNIYDVNSFPTIIRTDKVGRVYKKNIGITSINVIKEDIFRIDE